MTRPTGTSTYAVRRLIDDARGTSRAPHNRRTAWLQLLTLTRKIHNSGVGSIDRYNLRQTLESLENQHLPLEAIDLIGQVVLHAHAIGKADANKKESDDEPTI